MAYYGTMTMSDGGKGSSPRPYSVSMDTYNQNFDRIFSKQRVSGVPYEVDMPDVVAELERENFMLRARIQRLEEELERFRDDGK